VSETTTIEWTRNDDGTVYRPGHLPPRSEWDDKQTVPMYRVGKKVAGRLLDGREHNAFPAVGA
jgi:hypothetical protein